MRVSTTMRNHKEFSLVARSKHISAVVKKLLLALICPTMETEITNNMNIVQAYNFMFYCIEYVILIWGFWPTEYFFGWCIIGKNIPVSYNILHNLHGIWSVILKRKSYLVQLVKQAHTVIVSPQTAHLQTIYFLPISHHLLALRLFAWKKKKKTYSGLFYCLVHCLEYR